MSFILDALKKSETDRQQRSSAEFSKVPASSGPAGAPRWLLVLGILLTINLVVLLGLFFRTSDDPEVRPAPAASEVNATPATQLSVVKPDATGSSEEQASFANRVADAKLSRPAINETEATTPPTSVPPTFAPLPAVNAAQTAFELPTIYEVIADGSIVLPELHLDIHVFSDVPEDRFVFINMSKQRENSQLSEGPLVKEITPDGVILAYRGKSFLLPRD